MARIIGESDSIETIRHYLLSQGIAEVESMEEIYEFYMKKIPSEDKKHKQVQKMLEVNTSILIGAIGEEKVINTLRKLPDSYYVLNEIQIKLSRSVLWKKYIEYIKSAQIDHIVIGPTGIFLIETKNWDEMNISSVHRSPHKQTDRAGTLFWIAQKNRFDTPYKSYNLVVTLNSLPKFYYRQVYQLSLEELTKFILTRKLALSQKHIEKIKNWLLHLKVVSINRQEFFF
jgi:hypothetical protein